MTLETYLARLSLIEDKRKALAQEERLLEKEAGQDVVTQAYYILS